jgi:hypothetical protein
MAKPQGPKGLNSTARLAGPGIVVRQNGGLTAPHLARTPKIKIDGCHKKALDKLDRGQYKLNQHLTEL